MIRLSSENDINGIVCLWEESFGDSEKDIFFFLNTHYKPHNTIVCELDDEIVSVLFLLDGEMHIDGVDYPSYYLYAACTSLKYRGKGYMGDLLRFAQSISAERNRFFIALKPAEESLYNYYAKFGYRPVFTKKTAVLDKADLCENTVCECDYNISELSIIRNRFFNDINYFKWDEKSVKFAFDHHKYFGGEVLANRNGYILYSVDGRKLIVKESAFTQKEFLFCVSEIIKNIDIDSVRVELPYGYEFECSKNESGNAGMLLPLCDEADYLLKNINDAYLALTLD